MKNRIMLLFIVLILFSGIVFAINEKIVGEEKIETIQKSANTFDFFWLIFWLILIFIILVLIAIFILIKTLALKIRGSNNPILIGATIGFLIGLLSFVTLGYPALPIFFFLSIFGLAGWDSLLISSILAPFIYANIGALIGVMIKNKLKNKKIIRKNK